MYQSVIPRRDINREETVDVHWFDGQMLEGIRHNNNNNQDM